MAQFATSLRPLPVAAALLLAACGGVEQSGPDGSTPADTDAGVATADAQADCGVCINGSCADADPQPVCVCEPGWEGDTCESISPPPLGAELKIWLDSNDPNANGSAPTLGVLPLWTSKSSSGGKFAAATGNEPTLVSHGELAVVEFDGIDDFMQRNLYTGFIGTDAYTIFIVTSLSEDATADALFAATEAKVGGNHGIYLEVTSPNEARFVHRAPFTPAGGDDVRTAAASVSPDTLHLVVARHAVGGTHSISVDGTEVAVDSAQGTIAASVNIAIGRLDVDRAERYLEGQLGEILIYAGDLGTNAASPKAEDVENYLKAKWGL